MGDQIRPCRKIGQDQPRVIVHINFIYLDSPMLYAKFRDNQPLVSGVEDFLMFIPYSGVAAILIM